MTPALAQEAEETVLEEIVVSQPTGAGAVEGILGGGDDAAQGKTVLTREQIKTSGDGSGDVNSVLRMLPNVQWVDDTSEDSGESASTLQDLRPEQFSISGAGVDQNNFVLDGVGINSMGGHSEANNRLIDDSYAPLPDQLYSLHSQTVYVPQSLVESITVEDSNISARYGDFQGGVVSLETLAPSDTWTGFLEAEGSGSPLTNYKLATEDGENPRDIDPIDFRKYNGALAISGPILEGFNFLSSVSVRSAQTTRDRQPEYVDEIAETQTFSTSVLNKLELERDFGTINVSSMINFYDQEFESHNTYYNGVVLKGDSTTNSLSFTKELDDIGAFSETTFNTKLFFNTSRKGRDEEESTYYDARYRYKGVVLDELSDVCQDVPSETTVKCGYGGGGDLYQDEYGGGGSFDVSTRILNQSFHFGGGFSRTILRRERPETVTTYTSQRTGSFTCSDPNDPFCYDDKGYLSYKQVRDPYDVTVGLTKLDFWSELDLTFGDFEFRPGVRFDYEDYLENLTVAPRLRASWFATDNLTITTGFNRYYDNAMLSYALNAKIPDTRGYRRTIEGGVVSNEDGGDGWQHFKNFANTNYDQFGLSTPYNDEFAFGFTYDDLPWLGGKLRANYVQRWGADQIVKSQDSSKEHTYPTNDGKSRYRSVSVEYARGWNDLSWGPLESLGLSATATWSDSHKTGGGYYDEIEYDDYIYYKGSSYTRPGFDEVTGNMDIPVRGSVRLQGGFFENRLSLWTAAAWQLGYEGVKDSNENIELEIDGETIRHDVYVDHDYDPTVFVNAGAAFTLSENKWGKTVVTARIDNLLDDTGNATADDKYPYKTGRQFWFGLKASF
ncbi:TonB-dependent receptor plug domain-containing protein [Pseudovibrio exalbescens]|uniref:TonB-dependent receptor plug domain-containing protein n=1 Tax=Pseudovibrio exalbescens TaxID=197461 RepID=UPI00236645B8|nr:TonB-dependent receptor plug domain-containing protein [Pseudovibrio exalbescens]MDD7911024.1 TonB-dependent receptor plug domain-containing protein [Pseudovibrio exalbescens]